MRGLFKAFWYCVLLRSWPAASFQSEWHHALTGSADQNTKYWTRNSTEFVLVNLERPA